MPGGSWPKGILSWPTFTPLVGYRLRVNRQRRKDDWPDVADVRRWVQQKFHNQNKEV